MQTLDEFMAKQAAELEAKRKELDTIALVGDIPGLSPFLVHGSLYGVRHLAYKLQDMAAFLEWAESNTAPMYAVEGQYKSMLPALPDHRNYAGASIVAEGQVKVDYSTITGRFSCYFAVEKEGQLFKISFDAPVFNDRGHLTTCRKVTRYVGDRAVEWKWSKPMRGRKQYLRVGVGREDADLETLLTLQEFRYYFMPTE